MRKSEALAFDKRTRVAHLAILVVLQLVMAAELVFLIIDQQWLHVFLVVGVMATMLAPTVLKRRLLVQIPSEIQILAILFVFATIFLGEVRDYYERFWWWDLLLHATAGLLLGLLGRVDKFRRRCWAGVSVVLANTYTISENIRKGRSSG